MIRHCTHLLLLLQIHATAIGQNPTIDSLQNLLFQNQNDSTKTMLYLSIGNAFRGNNIDSVAFYYNKAFETATCPTCSIPKAESLRSIGLLKGFQKDSTSINYLLKAIAMYKSLGLTTKVAHLQAAVGNTYIRFDRLDKAKEWFWKSIHTLRPVDDFNKIAEVHSNIGYCFAQSAIYDSAAIHLRTSLEYRMKGGEKASSYALLNIGVVYFQSENLEMALNYYQKALNRAREENDRNIERVCYQNIGALYTKTKDYDQATEFLSKAMALGKEQNDSSAMATYYASVADIEIDKGDIKKALENYLAAKDVFPKNGSSTRRLFVHLNLSRTYLTLSQEKDRQLLGLCIEEGLIAYRLSTEALNTSNQLEAASILFKAYKATGKHQQASEFASTAIALSDSLYNKQRVDAIAEVQEKYETEKKELEIALLNKDNALKQQELNESAEAQKRQAFITSGALIVLLLSLTVVALLFRQAKRRKRTNAQLLEQNKTIEKQKEQVEQALLEITQRDEEKELLLKEIHHRVKNNLQVVSSLLDLQSKQANEGEKAALAEGQSRVRAMALIHEKLYQSQSVSEIDFEAYCKQLSHQIAQLFPNGQSIDCEVDVVNVKLDIDTAIPVGLILNELITNAYKYAFPNGKGRLRISAKKNEQHTYTLRIEDTGEGLPDHFDWRKSKSLGLRLVHRLARQLYGAAEYSNDGKSTFEITFKDTIERKAIA